MLLRLPMMDGSTFPALLQVRRKLSLYIKCLFGSIGEAARLGRVPSGVTKSLIVVLAFIFISKVKKKWRRHPRTKGAVFVGLW